MQRERVHVEKTDIQAEADENLDPTESELILALQRTRDLEGSSDGYATTMELAAALGWRPLKVREQLLELKARDLLEVASDWRENLAGRRTRVPVYRLRVD